MSQMPEHDIAGLDRIDRRLHGALQLDGRITNLELADTIGLSPTATAERVKRLTRDGFIVGYVARLDPAKLELGLVVFIEIKLDRMAPDVFEAIDAAVAQAPEVLEWPAACRPCRRSAPCPWRARCSRRRPTA